MAKSETWEKKERAPCSRVSGDLTWGERPNSQVPGDGQVQARRS
jgi:hypothetical protein